MIVNGGFESGNLAPWYEDRTFGATRPWIIGSLDPNSGSNYAFNLGPLELRQDFLPILGSQITQFSFFVSHQFPNRGNPNIEIFYSDGNSSGLQEIILDPSHATGSSSSGWIWDEVNLLTYVDPGREVSGISVVGISDNVLGIDSFTLEAIPEPSAFFLIAMAFFGLRMFRQYSNNVSKRTASTRSA